MPLNLNSISLMKPQFFFLPALLLAARLTAADLSQVVAEISKYESGANAEPLRQIENAIRESAGQPARRAEVEAALTKLLAPASTFEARRFACLQLAAIGTESSLPAIAALLDQPETTGMACLALGSHPSPRANELLRAALSASKDLARAQIIVTLGDREDAAAVGLLARLARDSDRTTAEAAVSSLGKIASHEALEVLASLRRESERSQVAREASLVAADRAVRRGNRAGAAAIYEELLAAAQPAFMRRAAFEGLLRMDGDQGEQRVLAALRGADPLLKASALAQVRLIQSPGASAKFAREIPRLEPPDQVLMIESLAARPDDAARSAIAEQLESKDASVRRAAVLALARLGDIASVPALASALSAESASREQQTIEMALASFPGAAVDRQLIALLKTSRPAAKSSLIHVLARRGSRSATPVLLEESGKSDPAVASAAFRALGKLAGADDLPILLDKMASQRDAEVRAEAQSAALQIISRSGRDGGSSPVVLSALAKAGDIETRRALIALLPACGDAPALAAVQAARAGQEAAARQAAFRALIEWPNALAIDPLLEAVQSASQNSERVLALRGAVRLLGAASDFTAPELAGRFQQAMAATKNDDEKKLVLGGLANLHDPIALNLVEPFLNDPAVQAEAAQATIRLAPYTSGAARQATRSALQTIAGLPVDQSVRQSAGDLLETMDRFDDYILAWQVSGPYAQEGKDGQALFEIVFPPESAQAPKGISQDETDMIPWQTMPAGVRKDRPWQLDLGQLYPGENCVAYARTWIYSETQQPARLEFGSDDGLKAWLNGRVILSVNRGGDVVPATDKVPVTLRQGWNPLLLKITQWTSGWGFCARVAQPDGAPISGLRAALYPPK